MKCKHNNCRCIVQNQAGGDGYCSDSCRQQKMQTGKCACGHTPCR